MTAKIIGDFRSDTVTGPTESMRRAMAQAVVGDDGYGDDPTVFRLEAMSAARVGKEAALFVPSGSFGNQLALFTNCERGTEVILDEGCHIVQHEAGSPALIAGVQLRTIATARGIPSAEEIASRIRDPEDYHQPRTSLICLENAHSNGLVHSLADMDAIRSLSLEKGIPLHLDGARIFNAALALGVSAAQIAARADSVMFCLSKGLSAPVGSLLCGDARFIAAARRKRKAMGGQLRQAGVLAACGIVGLEEVLPLLPRDHENARLLAGLLSEIPCVEIQVETVHINMVFFRFRQPHMNAECSGSRSLVAELGRRGFRVNGPMGGSWRLVTHRETSESAVKALAAALQELCPR